MGQKKGLTQQGLNRVMWHLLRDREDGKFTIPENAIDEPNPEDVIEIQYDPSVKSFTLRAHKIKSQSAKSDLIILPSGSLN